MTAKIAISLPDDLVEQARRAVALGEASSVSAYVATALREHGRRGSLAHVLADLDVQLGPVPEADRDWARDALGLGRVG